MTTPWQTINDGPNAMRIMMSLFEEYREDLGRHNSVIFHTCEEDGEIGRRQTGFYDVYIDGMLRKPFIGSPEELILYGWDRWEPGIAFKIEYNARTRTGRLAFLKDLPGEKWPDGVTKI